MKAVKACDKVRIWTAQAERHHTLGKSLLLLPAAKDMTSSVLEVKVAKQFELNPLCHATTSQISDMASNDKLQLTEKVKDNNIILFKWMKIIMLVS